MAITILVLLNQPQSTAPVHAQIFEVRTQPGMITSFRLPDSTLVYLNSGSVLKYPSIFTGNIREVSLNGEAYFEVAKDPEHKFIVSTPQKSKVEVLGTHFNLEAFDEMDEVITTLVEGKVEFVYEKDGQGSKILMRPGQKVIYNNKDGQILSYNTNGESELAWMDQKIIFDKTPFKAALHILKKRYNVDFIVNTSKFDKYTFTGAFTEQYIEEILENFKISSHIRWRNVKLTNNQSEERRQIEIY
ncbi:FecR family protein [Bacteroides thetaiotaomicron]|nr:FecR family protein [Bacteroides thetaiotaomicron]